MKQTENTALLAVLALLFSVSAFARDKNQHSVEIPFSVQVGSTQLEPGTYKVDWQGTGPELQVNFVRNGKTVATVPGTLKTNDAEVVQDDIVTDTTSAIPKRSKRSISPVTKNPWSLSRVVCSSLA